MTFNKVSCCVIFVPPISYERPFFIHLMYGLSFPFVVSLFVSVHNVNALITVAL